MPDDEIEPKGMTPAERVQRMASANQGLPGTETPGKTSSASDDASTRAETPPPPGNSADNSAHGQDSVREAGRSPGGISARRRKARKKPPDTSREQERFDRNMRNITDLLGTIRDAIEALNADGESGRDAPDARGDDLKPSAMKRKLSRLGSLYEQARIDRYALRQGEERRFAAEVQEALVYAAGRGDTGIGAAQLAAARVLMARGASGQDVLKVLLGNSEADSAQSDVR